MAIQYRVGQSEKGEKTHAVGESGSRDHCERARGPARGRRRRSGDLFLGEVSFRFHLRTLLLHRGNLLVQLVCGVFDLVPRDQISSGSIDLVLRLLVPRHEVLGLFECFSDERVEKLGPGGGRGGGLERGEVDEGREDGGRGRLGGGGNLGCGDERVAESFPSGRGGGL